VRESLQFGDAEIKYNPRICEHQATLIHWGVWREGGDELAISLS
jgi:hypothetical protein